MAKTVVNRRNILRKACRPVMESLETRLLMTWVGATSGSNNDSAHSYLNTANWAGGVIDDSFNGVSLSENTTLFLNANRTTGANGLNLNYGGEGNLVIKSTSGTARTLTLNGEITGNFGGSGTRTVTIGDGSAKVNVDLAGGKTFNVASGDKLVLSNVVSNGSVTKTGAGKLSLGGNNSFAGGLNVRAGTVIGAATGSLGGGGSGAVSVGATSGGADASLRLEGNAVTYANALTVESGGTGVVHLGGSVTTTTALTGSVSLGRDVHFAMDSGTLNVSGAFTGTGSIINDGTGTGIVTLNGTLGASIGGVVQSSRDSEMRLGGNNSVFASGVTITSGVLQATSSNGLGTGTIQLGATAGNEDAALYIKTGVANNINVRAGGTGNVSVETTYSSGTANISGEITIARDLMLRRQTNGSLKVTGNITGSGDLHLHSDGTVNSFKIESPLLDINGRLINTGTGGSIMLYAPLGPGVSEIIQDSDMTFTIIGVEIPATTTLSAIRGELRFAATAEPFNGSDVIIGLYDDHSGTTIITGDVTITGSHLRLKGTRASNPGEVLTIIQNDGTDAVVGRFIGLPDGANITWNEVTYVISYDGGDGNDVTLTDVNVSSGGVSDLGFEHPNIGATNVNGPSNSSWHFSGAAGFAGNGSDFLGGRTAAEGSQVAYLMAASTGYPQIQTTFHLSQPGKYTLSGKSSQLLPAAINYGVNAVAYIDGFQRGIISYLGNGTAWAQWETTDFELNAGTHTIKIVRYNFFDPPAGDAILLDDLHLNFISQGAPPSVPTLTGHELSSGSFQLNWLEAEHTEAYDVQRAVLDATGSIGAWSTIKRSLSASARSYTDNDTSTGTAYAYRVVAFGPGGATPSNNVTTSPIRSATLTASADSSWKVNLAWTTSNATTTGYAIERRVAGTNEWVAVVAGLPSTANAYTDESAVPETFYEYRLIVANPEVNPLYSNIATVSTADVQTITLTAESIGFGRIGIAWQLNGGDGGRGYRVYRSTSSDFAREATTLRAILPGGTVYFDTEVVVGERYYYAVDAVNGAGVTIARSNIASAVALAEVPDQDGDGIPDDRDPDRDNDGVPEEGDPIGGGAPVSTADGGDNSSTLTVDLAGVGDGNYETPQLIDLSAYHDITRIELYEITDPLGLVWDDFSFTADDGNHKITFDDLALDARVTTQYSGAVFSGANVVRPAGLGFYGSSQPHTIGEYPYTSPTNIDFSSPVNNLKFYMCADDSEGEIAIVRVYTAGLNLIAYRSGGNSGKVVSAEIENEGDASKYLILTNNDFEEQNESGDADFVNDTAMIKSNGGFDDDLTRITLKKIPQNFSGGKVEIQLSHPGAVKLFKSDGTLLYKEGETSSEVLTLDLESPDGYLKDLVTKDVDIWLEGLTKASDFTFSYVYTDSNEYVKSLDKVHITIADWNYRSADNENAAIVISVPPQNLGEWISDPAHAIDLPKAAQIKNNIEGLALSHITSFQYVSNTGSTASSEMIAGAEPDSSISKNFTIAYRPSDGVTLTQGQINALKQQKQWDVISDAAGQFKLSTAMDIQSHQYIKEGPDLKLNAFDNTYFTLAHAPETSGAMNFDNGLNAETLTDALLGRAWTEDADPAVFSYHGAIYINRHDEIPVSEPVFNQLRVLISIDANAGRIWPTVTGVWTQDVSANMAIIALRGALTVLGGDTADTRAAIKVLAPGEIYDLYLIDLAEKQQQYAAEQALPPSPAKVRVYGVLRLLGAVGEVGGGSALASIPSGVTQIAAIGVYAHAVDTFWAGIQEIRTGELQRSYTSQIVSAGAAVVGVKHETAILVGEFTDLGFGIIGSTPALGINKLRGLRAARGIETAQVAARALDGTAEQLSKFELLIKRAAAVVLDAPENKVIFYSGGQAALAEAKQIQGGLILEDIMKATSEGASLYEVVNAGIGITPAQQDALWRLLSRRLAANAKGVVRVVNKWSDTAEDQERLRKSVWLGVEYPELLENPNVTTIWANPPKSLPTP